jgi:hypothetical protein
MIVFSMGPLQDQSSVSGGASLVQTWLNTARQRAIRDKVPSGLRFLAGTTLPSQGSASAFYVTRMVYLEGGTELFGTLWFTPVPGVNPDPKKNQTTFSLSLQLPTTPAFSPTDTLIINSGLPHQIASANPTASPPTITITGIWPYAIPQTAALPFRIIRGPTALTGASVGADSENILTMQRGSCVNFNPLTANPLYPGGIDLGNFGATGVVSSFIPKYYFTGANGSSTTADGVSTNPDYTSNGLDIMFAPDGTVTSPATSNPIAFWISGTSVVVANGTLPAGVAQGTPVVEAMHSRAGLVVLYPRTGQVVGYTVEPDQINVSGSMKANAMKDVQ